MDNNDIKNQEVMDENFEQMLENSLNRTDNFMVGDQVKGTVIYITKENIFVDISGKSEAIIDINEFKDDDGKITLKKGDTIEAYIVSTGSGEIHLTTKIGKSAVNHDLLNLAYVNSIPINGLITGIIKGGYSISISGIKCFCPFSQIDLKAPVNPETLINKSFLFKIIEFEEKGQNIILSRRVLLEEQRVIKEENLKKTLNVGDIIKGTISSIRNFGLFINIDGIEALIPKSELSWGRSIDMDIYAIKQEITARVKSIDWDTRRITLSIKDLNPEPWENISKYSIGQKINGKVINIIKNGAFVEIEPGLEGYIHVSKMSLVKKINRPEDAVAIGDIVNVRINNIIPDEKKLSLELLTDEADPWQMPIEELADTIQIGIIESVKTSGINVRLSNGILGFVPKGELHSKQDSDILKKYMAGKEIKVSITDIIKNERRLILSEVKALKIEENEDYEKFQNNNSSSEKSTLGYLFKQQFDKIQKNMDK